MHCPEPHDQVEDHSPLGPHDQIEIAQADVEVDNDDFLAGARQRAPRAAVEVVLPTPPLPDVTTTTWAI